jgi:hypothetical protein
VQRAGNRNFPARDVEDAAACARFCRNLFHRG